MIKSKYIVEMQYIIIISLKNKQITLKIYEAVFDMNMIAPLEQLMEFCKNNYKKTSGKFSKNYALIKHGLNK
jgi:hypothetical protein